MKVGLQLLILALVNLAMIHAQSNDDLHDIVDNFISKELDRDPNYVVQIVYSKNGSSLENDKLFASLKDTWPAVTMNYDLKITSNIYEEPWEMMAYSHLNVVLDPRPILQILLLSMDMIEFYLNWVGNFVISFIIILIIVAKRMGILLYFQ